MLEFPLSVVAAYFKVMTLWLLAYSSQSMPPGGGVPIGGILAGGGVYCHQLQCNAFGCNAYQRMVLLGCWWYNSAP